VRAAVADASPASNPRAASTPPVPTPPGGNPTADVYHSATANLAFGGSSANSCVPYFDGRGVVVSRTSDETAVVVVSSGEDGSPASITSVLVEVSNAAFGNFDGRGLVVVHFAFKTAVEVAVTDPETCLFASESCVLVKSHWLFAGATTCSDRLVTDFHAHRRHTGGKAGEQEELHSF